MVDRRMALAELWRELNRTIHDRFRHAMRGHELHPGAMFLLRHLKDEPGLTVSDLARRAGVVKSGVSKVTEQLARMGLVEKRPDPTDQRLLRLFLTEKGRVTRKEMESTSRAAWLDVVGSIPDEQLADVEQGLRILLAAVTTAQSSEGAERS